MSAAAFADAPLRARHVFIVSFDQGAPVDIQNSEMPVFQSMLAAGAHTWRAWTVVPSLTLPAHASMLTGVGVQKHQVLWNELNPEAGFVKEPTIFALAKARGLVTAMFAGKAKFQTLAVPGSLDCFKIPAEPEAEHVAAAFAAEVAALKPNLCFIHFGDADVAGHAFGVHSPEKLRALAACDKALGAVRDAVQKAGLLADSVFILTADHGGHDRTPEENADRARRGEPAQPGTHGSAAAEDVDIPWVAWGRGVKKGREISAPVVQYDTAATALWLLGVPLPESFWGRPVAGAFE